MTDDPPFELSGEPGPGEDFESDVAELTRAIRKYLDAELRGAPLVAMIEALENVEAWYQDDDPRSMGWVDDKGRP